jgi:hypothetical protein
MVTTPKVIGPDGVARETTIFSTTMSSRFFRGQIDADTVDMQISIRGAAFTSDPDLIVFEGSTFSFPNPTTFPEGLELAAGLNLIEVRSISFSGAVSANAVVEATLVQESDTGLVGEIPSNISIEQKQDSVEVRIEGVPDSTFRGMNFYASRFQGGGSTGYQRVNINVVTDYVTLQETSSIGTLTVDSAVAASPDGTPAADPLYVKVTQTQTRSSNVLENLEDIVLTPELAAAITEQEQDNLLKTDFVKVYEVPETTSVIRTTYTLDSVVSRRFYLFSHNRQFGPANNPSTVPIGEFASTPLTEPLFYVATAVFYDSERQLEIESANSPEVVGQPTVIEENVGTFPAPARLQIVQDTIASLQRTTPQIAVQPGAVIRDVFVDPLSNEITRLRLLLDFLYRTQSFDTLLQIDGVESDGTSTPVARSPYKQALQRVFGINNPTEVQTILDTAFEQLASRNNIFRLAGVRARGFVTFFTRSRPTATLFIPLGTRVASGSLQYVTTTDAAIPIGNVAAFFNPSTGLYQVDVAIEADQPGSASNLGAGQIRTIVSNLSGLSVTNRNQTFGGTNQETNLHLAIRGRNALAAVDSGTERGTLQTAANVAGVQGVQVVGAGDPLMQRDFDPDYDKHIGGKVDVWARGESVGTVTDSFAFTYEIATDVQFVLIGNPLNLMFRALDVNLSTSNPLAQMLDDQAIGFGLRNASTGMYFDLTDVQILDYQTIQLSSSVVQPTVTLGNVVLGDYRYVESTRFVFLRQPVSSVVSVTGTVSGDLPAANYRFVQPDDPLLKGRSTRAQSYLDIIQVNGIPSGDLVPVTGEEHLLLGEFDEFMNNLGANPLTVTVFNSTRTVRYRGPEDPSGVSDYVIVPGTQTTALAVRRTVNSQIRSGETVLVDYEHSENFTVEYQTNFVIPTLQQSLDALKHVTADVLGKAAVKVPIDVSATVVTQTGFRSAVVDTNLRRNLTAALRVLPQGGALRQSDIIAVIEQTRGVSYVEVPLRKLTRAAGSIVVRESVPSADGDVEVMMGNTGLPYSTTTVKTWLLQNALNNPTSTGGGDGTQFAGVYKDDVLMALLLSSPAALKNTPDQAYIIGDAGIVIPSYSDDTTIQTNFPAANTPSEIAAIRRDLTANKVLVSLAANDRPQLHSFGVTYTVAFVEARTQDIELSQIEVFESGNFIFTYTEDRRLGR